VQNCKEFDFVILIPVFQDDDKISLLKKQLDIYLKNYNYFICFVDDSISEKTSETITKYFEENFIILRRKKTEKFSVRFSASLHGFRWIISNIKSQYVVEIDSDLSHHPKDITKGINKLKEANYDLVIGSKYLKNSIVENRELFRIFISKFMTVICRNLFNSKITDYTNTFRFYNYDLIKEFSTQKLIFKSPIGHLNNLLLIIRKKHRIAEIPIEYIETNTNSSVKKSSLIRYFVEFIYCILINKFR
jgi:dolichol-phosphate mannosyltransferase